MNSITRYIFGQTALVMIFVTTALSFVIWLTRSLQFIDLVVNRGLPISDFLWLALLIMPRFVSLILPFACFVATIYVYNRLIADRELIVLRGAGMSNLELSRPAIVLGLATAIVIYAFNIYLLPVAYREYSDLRYNITSDYSSMLLQEGRFNTLPARFTIFVRERQGAGVLKGILVHDGRDPEEPVTFMAHEGRLVNTDNGPRLVLIEGNRQQVNRSNGSISFLQFEKETIDINIASGNVPAGRKRKPEEMFLWELFDPDLRKNEIYGPIYSRYLAEGHSRIASPMLAVGFVLLALAILLSGDFSRRGQNLRIFAAVLLTVHIFGVSLVSFNMSSDDVRLIPVMYAIVAIPIVAGLIVLGPMSRQKKRAKARFAATGPDLGVSTNG